MQEVPATPPTDTLRMQNQHLDQEVDGRAKSTMQPLAVLETVGT